MTPEQRTKLLRRLYLFGPALSLLACSPIFFTGLTPLLPKSLPAGVQSYMNSAFMLAPLGWLLLTLGCSAGTCLGIFRRQGKQGATLVIFMILATPLLALAHILTIGAVAFTGCMIVTGGR